MEVESRAGQSVFLRGWGEYQPYSAQADRGGDLRASRHMAFRTTSAEALEELAAATRRRVDRRRPRPRAGLPVHRSRRPRDGAAVGDGPLRAARAPAPVLAQSAAALHGPRRRGQAARPRQPARQRRRAPCREFAVDVLGYRHYEGIVLDDGHRDRRLAEPHDRRPRADLRPRRAPGRRPPAPPRVLGRHPRGVPAGGRHLRRRRRARSRPRRPSTASRRASSCTASSPAATGSRSPPAATSSTTPSTSR